MSDKKMHEDELNINETLVRQLLDAQFPKWASLPITRVKSDGTDNAIYRLSTDMCVRLPRVSWALSDIEKEHKWLPQFAPVLPLRIPIPIGLGLPQGSYPSCWSIYSWLEGENASVQQIANSNQAATDLAHFLVALQKIDTAGGPPSRRGMPLAMKDNETREAIESLHGMIDTVKAGALWEECLKAPVWNKPPVWSHGDLLPGNLLVRNGRLDAVIDWGLSGIGDPACDLIAAWSAFSSESRNIFRATLAVDDATWMRGRGWALSIALIILPYYWDTNPGLVAVAKRMLNEIFSDA
jgi:aminoglycoside phosphotransferase (APT) family kinase protein